MPVVDDRGRVFGRFNLIDVALLVLLAGIIPLGYGAYALFRIPAPKLTEVKPNTRQHESEFRIVVHGENLRPYMRVSLNDMQGRTFLFKSDTAAEVVFGDVPPGEYDVVLYDNAQERGRLKKAFTLTPSALPSAQLDIAGFITGLNATAVKQITVGRKFGRSFEVMAVGKPGSDLAQVMAGGKPLEVAVPQTFRLPVLIRVNCDVISGSGGFGECVAGRVLGPGVYLDLPVENGRLPLLAVEIRPTTPPTRIDIGVRLNVNDPALPLINVGDPDVGYSMNEFAGGARISGRPSPTQVALSVPAIPTIGGWSYSGQPIRVGAPITIVTSRYQFLGIINAVPPPPSSK